MPPRPKGKRVVQRFVGPCETPSPSICDRLRRVKPHRATWRDSEERHPLGMVPTGARSCSPELHTGGSICGSSPACEPLAVRRPRRRSEEHVGGGGSGWGGSANLDSGQGRVSDCARGACGSQACAGELLTVSRHQRLRASSEAGAVRTVRAMRADRRVQGTVKLLRPSRSLRALGRVQDDHRRVSKRVSDHERGAARVREPRAIP